MNTKYMNPEDTYLSWDEFDQVKQYISTLLAITSEWNPLKGTMVDTNEFDTYHIFLSCRKNKSFGFGICNKKTMETIINETIEYGDTYKQYVFDKLHSKNGFVIPELVLPE